MASLVRLYDRHPLLVAFLAWLVLFVVGMAALWITSEIWYDPKETP